MLLRRSIRPQARQLLHTGKISFDEWTLKAGKVLESNEALDEMDSQNHPAIFMLSIFVACSLLIFTILLCLKNLEAIKDLKYEIGSFL